MNVAVVGQGFVGLTLSVFLGLNKFQVFGVENNQKKTQNNTKWKIPIF